MKTKESLTDVIERLYVQWQNAKEEDDKDFLATQVKKYALQYKEVTGDWYVREYKAT